MMSERYLRSAHIDIHTSDTEVANPVYSIKVDRPAPRHCKCRQCCCCCLVSTDVNILFLQIAVCILCFLWMMAFWSDFGSRGGMAPPGRYICENYKIVTNNGTGIKFIDTCEFFPWAATDAPGCRWTLWTYSISLLFILCGQIAKLSLIGLRIDPERSGSRNIQTVFGRKVFIRKINIASYLLSIISLIIWVFGCHTHYLPGVPTGSFSPEGPKSTLTIVWYFLFVTQAINMTWETLRVYGCKRVREDPRLTFNRSMTDDPSTLRLSSGAPTTPS